MKRYPHLVAFRVIQPIADAIAELAERDCTSPADTCRRLILAGLRANGIQIGAKAEMPLEPEPSFCPPHLEAGEPKKRGRPAKRTDGPTFALTVRMDSDLRRDLRRLADDETARRGVVVSLNDLMLEAAAAASARGGSHERH